MICIYFISVLLAAYSLIIYSLNFDGEIRIEDALMIILGSVISPIGLIVGIKLLIKNDPVLYRRKK